MSFVSRQLPDRSRRNSAGNTIAWRAPVLDWPCRSAWRWSDVLARVSDGRLVPPSRIAGVRGQRNPANAVISSTLLPAAGSALGLWQGRCSGGSAIRRWSARHHRPEGLTRCPRSPGLFILWLGFFVEGCVDAVGVFFPIYLSVMGAVLSVDRKIVEVGRAFGCRV
jgi:sulfonate transport system permease protein